MAGQRVRDRVSGTGQDCQGPALLTAGPLSLQASLGMSHSTGCRKHSRHVRVSK